MVGPTGASGSSGPAGVYRGLYSFTTRYYYNAVRRDIVSYGGQYWIANNPARDGQVGWGTPGVADWTSFGAQFTSVATALLLAEAAVITVSLTLGTSGSNVGFIQSANYVPGSTGFIIRADGYAEFNNVLIRGNLSTVTAVFNPDDPNNTFPTTGSQTSVYNTPTGPLNVGSGVVCGGALIGFHGWGTPDANPNKFFGKPSITFLTTMVVDFSTVTAVPAKAIVVYRINGGAWTAIPAIEAYSYTDAGCNQTLTLPLTGLGATDLVEFGVRCASADAAVMFNSTRLSVLVFNL